METEVLELKSIITEIKSILNWLIRLVMANESQ